MKVSTIIVAVGLLLPKDSERESKRCPSLFQGVRLVLANGREWSAVLEAYCVLDTLSVGARLSTTSVFCLQQSWIPGVWQVEGAEHDRETRDPDTANSVVDEIFEEDRMLGSLYYAYILQRL